MDYFGSAAGQEAPLLVILSFFLSLKYKEFSKIWWMWLKKCACHAQQSLDIFSAKMQINFSISVQCVIGLWQRIWWSQVPLVECHRPMIFACLSLMLNIQISFVRVIEIMFRRPYMNHYLSTYKKYSIYSILPLLLKWGFCRLRDIYHLV